MSYPAPSPPLVSVIVAAHDVQAHVAAAIASLRAQTHAGFEALVIDDGSTDDTAARAEAAIGGDPRFRLIRQPNRGLSAARNAGLAQARGTHVAFLDGDDRFAPRFLETMLAALADSGCDWAACAVMLCYPDGRQIPHSAIHGAPVPGPARRLPLDDAREAARLFPSAWNKLYCRDLIGPTRFVEGTWFEDHEFYWTLAARTQAISLVPEPLCLHGRDRPGQITAQDDERVFDQIAVLGRLAGIMRGSGKRHADEALERVATRVVHERAQVLRRPERRRRFLSAAWALFGDLGLRYTADWDDDIDHAPALVMAGVLPLSIVLWGGGDGRALKTTLNALSAQAMPDFELLLAGVTGRDLPDALPCGARLRVIAPRAPGLAAALQAGLAAAAGRYLALIRPGDLPAADGLRRWINGLERSGAALGVSGHERGTWERGHYRPPLTGVAPDGAAAGAISPASLTLDLPPQAALGLDPEPGAKLYRSDRLRELGLASRLQGLPDALAAQALTLAMALAEGRATIFPFPAIAVPPRTDRTAVNDLGAAIRVLPERLPDLAALPAGWPGPVFARLMQQRLGQTPSRLGRYRLVAAAALAARRHGLRLTAELALDPDIAPNLLRAIPGGRERR